MKKYDYSKRGPLIKVQLAPGRWVKMYERDAVARGLVTKEIPGAANKMMVPDVNKTRAEIVIQRDDFTQIPGIGKATCEILHDHGILTFDELRTADVDFLSRPAQAAVETWRAFAQ